MNETRRRYLLLALGGAFVIWLAARNGSIGRESFLFFGALVPSVILHEVSHGAAALLFGDDTAKRAGRLTLNPIPHIDPVWTLLVPGMLALIGAPVLGMAKPVPVNPRRMRRPRDHSLIVSLVGPATNILIAAAAALAFRTLQPRGLALELLLAVGVINVVLAVFNLIPIPPLDGSAVIERFVPNRYLGSYFRIRQYAPIIFMLLFFMGSGFLARLLDPAVRLWWKLLV